MDIGRGAVAGTRAIAATAQGVPPELAFQGIGSPPANTMMAQDEVDALFDKYSNITPD